MRRSAVMAQKPGIIRENIPHTVILSFWLVCLFVGLLDDLGWVGALFGMTFGSAIDPPIFILSVAIGCIPNYQKFLIATVIALPGIMTFDYFQQKEWLATIGHYLSPDELLQFTVPTGLAMITVSHAANFVIRLIVRKDENA